MTAKLIAALQVTLLVLSLAPAAWGAEVPEVSVENALVTLREHAGGVNCVAFSPDGSMLACGVGLYRSSGQVVVWNTGSWKRRYTLGGFRFFPVRWLRFSPNGEFLAAANDNGVLIVCDAATGQKQLRIPKAHSGTHMNPSLAAFSVDSRTLLTPQRSGTTGITLWDLESRGARKEIIGETASGGLHDCVACSPDGRLWASGGNGVVTIWNAANRRKLATFDCEGAAKHVAFSPDSQYLMARTKSVIVWKVSAGKKVLSILTLGRAVDFSFDSMFLAVSESPIERPGGVRLWSLEEGSEPILLRNNGNDSSVVGLAVSPGNDLLVTIGILRRNVGLWDLKTNRQIGALVGHKPAKATFGYSASALAFDSRGKMLAVSAGNEVTVWDVPATLAKLD